VSRATLSAFVLSLLLLAGCRGSVENLTGDYEAEGAGTVARRISLRSDGGGALSVGAEEAPFRWEVRENGQVFLHTRQGGIISGRKGEGTLELNMPGAGRQIFRKLEN
jgi:hypothetical protein